MMMTTDLKMRGAMRTFGGAATRKAVMAIVGTAWLLLPSCSPRSENLNSTGGEVATPSSSMEFERKNRCASYWNETKAIIESTTNGVGFQDEVFYGE
jgi:hypothetical protein